MSNDSARLPEKVANLNSMTRTAMLVCLVGLVCYFAAILGSSLRVPPRMISPLWPGTALLLAVLLLVPGKIWPPLITIGLGVAFATGLKAGVPLPANSALLLGDLVEVLIAAVGVRLAFKQVPRLNTVKALARYSFFAVGLAPLASAFVGASADPHAYYWLYWRIWFFSSVLAMLILTPAVLSFFHARDFWRQKGPSDYIEAAVLLTAILALAYFLFILSPKSEPPALLYALPPFLLWSALRFEMMGTTTSMIIVAFTSIWGAAHGRGPFIAEEPLTNILTLQLFLVFAATPFVVLATVVQERRESEQTLRTSEEKFSKAFRQSPMVLTLTSTQDYRYLDVNESFEQATGWRRDQVIGRTPFDLELWVDPQQRVEFTKRILSEGAVRGLEGRFRRRDGTEIVGLGSAELIEIAGERCILSVVMDITDRKRAEEALSVANSQLRLAMGSGKAVGWEWDIRSGQAFRFGDLQSIYGVPAESQSGTSEEFYRWVHPDDRKRVSESIAEACRDHKPYSAEFRIIRADGTARWLDAKGEFYYAQDGNPLRMLGIAMDVTERKHAEEMLREYEKAVESADEMIAVVDREYRYVLANRAFLEYRNMTRDKVVGRKVSEIVNPGVFEQIKGKLDECFQGKVVRFEMPYTYPELGQRDLFLSYFPIEGANGIVAAACILQDFTERKRAERELERTREELVEAQRVAQLGSWQWDISTGTISWSKELYRIHGLDPNLPPRSMEDLPALFTPESWNHLQAAMEEGLLTGSVPDLDLEVVLPDGRRRWVTTRGETVRDETGRARLLRGTVQDITERKRMESELHESQSRLSSVIASAMDAIIAVDDEQRIVLFNAAAEKMFGCSSAEALGCPIEQFIPQRFRSEHRAHIRRFAERGVVNRTMGSLGVLWGLRSDGEEFPMEASIAQIPSDGRRLFTVIIRDISARLQAEEAVRESERRFRLVANTAPAMIWMSDPERQCNYFNQPWLEFTGRALEAELGDGWAEGVHPDDLSACLDIYRRSFDGREPFKMQYRLRRHDGEYRWILDSGVPRFNADGSFAGYIGSCIDVTHQKLAEEALADMGRRLIEAHEEERTWIARELHDDINQRIALLAIELEQLKQHIPESASASREHIRHLRQHLFEIGKDIQALSHRLHSSKLEYLGLSAAASSFCKELAEQQNVQIDFNHNGIPRTVPKEVSLCLFRVLQEALQNAVKYSRVRHFNVDLRATSEEIQLAVSDLGIGFDPVTAISGRGLGLISMQERVRLIKGELFIDSQPERGTTIRVRASLKKRESFKQAAG